MKRDLQDQFNKIHTWNVGLNMKLISLPKGKDLHIKLVGGVRIWVYTLHFISDSYVVCFIASDYFHDVNNISQEEVVLFLIENDKWFQRIDEGCGEINTNPKLAYPTNIVDLMSEVMKGLED